MRAKTIGTNYNGANFLITQKPDLMSAILTRDIELMELILYITWWVCLQRFKGL